MKITSSTTQPVTATAISNAGPIVKGEAYTLKRCEKHYSNGSFAISYTGKVKGVSVNIKGESTYASIFGEIPA